MSQMSRREALAAVAAAPVSAAAAVAATVPASIEEPKKCRMSVDEMWEQHEKMFPLNEKEKCLERLFLARLDMQEAAEQYLHLEALGDPDGRRQGDNTPWAWELEHLSFALERMVSWAEADFTGSRKFQRRKDAYEAACKRRERELERD